MTTSLPRTKGFTLIELIVVMAVGAILAGIGLNGLNTINKRQNLVQTAKLVVSDIRLAKSLADAQQKPEICDRTDTLNGYRIKITGGNTLQIAGECGDKTSEYQSRTVSAQLSGLTEVFFPVMRQPVQFVGVGNQIVVTQNEQSIAITISQTGSVEFN